MHYGVLTSILKALFILYIIAFLFLKFLSILYKIKTNFGYKPIIIYDTTISHVMSLKTLISKCPTLNKIYTPLPIIGEQGISHSLAGVILPFLMKRRPFKFYQDSFATKDEGTLSLHWTSNPTSFDFPQTLKHIIVLLPGFEVIIVLFSCVYLYVMYI